jgi:hypothetical protein
VVCPWDSVSFERVEQYMSERVVIVALTWYIGGDHLRDDVNLEPLSEGLGHVRQALNGVLWR